MDKAIVRFNDLSLPIKIILWMSAIFSVIELTFFLLGIISGLIGG